MWFDVDTHLDFHSRFYAIRMSDSYVFLQDLEIGIVKPTVRTIVYGHVNPP